MINAFSSAEVSEITGITHRQLAYWDLTGLLKPSVRSASGRGSRRLYSVRDMVELKIIMKLLNHPLSLQRVRSSLRFIRALPEPLADLVILTDGETIYLYKEKDLVLDTLKQGQIVLRIVVEDLIAEVEKRVDEVAMPKLAAQQSV
jgi:DNA-binding transcriptional MerR regulator